MTEPVHRWIEAWTRGWRDAAPDVVASAYADDATFCSHPFRGAERPRDYVARAFADEEAVEFWFGEPRGADDGATVPYWAVLRDRSGRVTTIAGVSVLRFGSNGLVVEHRDFWAQEEGAHVLPTDWFAVVAHGRRGEPVPDAG